MAVVGFASDRVSTYKCKDGERRILPPTPRCELCSNPISGEYEKCWCCNIGDPFDGHNVQRIVAGSIYVPEWKDDRQHKEIQVMKKEGRRARHYANQYAELICEVWRQEYTLLATLHGSLVPAPTRWGSKNIAPHVLAQSLSDTTGLQVVDAMKYIRQTESEKMLSGRDERKANVDHSMESVYNIGQRDVFIIDDIMTTGYSMSEAARALRAAGCTGEIWGLIAARNVRESELISLGIVVTDNE